MSTKKDLDSIDEIINDLKKNGFIIGGMTESILHDWRNELRIRQHEESQQNVKNTPLEADLSKLTITDCLESTNYQIPIGERHICVVCEQTFPIAEMPINFSICGPCDSRGLKPKSCLDKNGSEFFPGYPLKNEDSSATVQILKISDTHIFDDKNGATEREDFINAGWVVHERVTEFNKDIWEMLSTVCKFKSPKIGSIACKKCSANKGYNLGQKWVICELYNKEG